jgi:hypothetical protein
LWLFLSLKAVGVDKHILISPDILTSASIFTAFYRILYVCRLHHFDNAYVTMGDLIPEDIKEQQQKEIDGM